VTSVNAVGALGCARIWRTTKPPHYRASAPLSHRSTSAPPVLSRLGHPNDKGQVAGRAAT